MKVLILSFYSPPDQTPGAFRIDALIKELLNELPDESSIQLFTTMPNRYQSYQKQAKELQEEGSLKIIRANIPSHKSGFIDQSLSFISYARQVVKLTKSQDYDLIFASTSRLMTGALGAYLARRYRIPFYLDIRDIFTDTFENIFPKIVVFCLKPGFNFLERYTLKTANKVNLISKGFYKYFNSKYNIKNFSYFTNGIDLDFIKFYSERKKLISKGKLHKNKTLKVLYAGNIGMGQGLDIIVPGIASELRDKVEFKIIGSGGRLLALKDKINKHNLTNINIFDPIDRKDLIEEYLDSDILFLHLNEFKAFEKVLPSKIFEYAATGKPIWAGLGGFSASFLRKEVPNTAVFSPANVSEAIRSLDTLKMGFVNRDEFIKKYSRVSISKLLAKDVISIFQQFRNADSKQKIERVK